MLTPALALTSFAATTPAHWRVEYGEENLLHGRTPYDPLPQVAGITVHLTFSPRAYELADCDRNWGSKVVLGGLHVLSCPDECAAHADVLALADGVQVWPGFCATLKWVACNPVTPRLMKTTTAMIPRPTAHGEVIL